MIAHGIRPFFENEITDGDKTDVRLANVTTLAHLFIRLELLPGARLRKTTLDLTEFQRKTRRARLAERLRRLPDQNVLIPTEAFSFLRTPNEHQAMRGFPAQTEREVTTLVVFREETAWRASWENQLRFIPTSYEIFIRQPDEQRINADWFYETSAIRAHWAPST